MPSPILVHTCLLRSLLQGRWSQLALSQFWPVFPLVFNSWCYLPLVFILSSLFHRCLSKAAAHVSIRSCCFDVCVPAEIACQRLTSSEVLSNANLLFIGSKFAGFRFLELKWLNCNGGTVLFFLYSGSWDYLPGHHIAPLVTKQPFQKTTPIFLPSVNRTLLHNLAWLTVVLVTTPL